MVPKKENRFCTYCQLNILDECDRNSFCHGKYFRPSADIMPNKKSGSSQKWEYSWNFTRKLVLLRDRNTCIRCKRKKKALEIHHIKRREYNGSNHPRNLMTLCTECHNATKARPIDLIFMDELKKKKNLGYWKKIGVVE